MPAAAAERPPENIRKDIREEFKEMRIAQDGGRQCRRALPRRADHPPPEAVRRAKVGQGRLKRSCLQGTNKVSLSFAAYAVIGKGGP
jgi:hypothetical protein